MGRVEKLNSAVREQLGDRFLKSSTALTSKRALVTLGGHLVLDCARLFVAYSLDTGEVLKTGANRCLQKVFNVGRIKLLGSDCRVELTPQTFR